MYIKANLEEKLLEDIRRMTAYLSEEVFPDSFRSQTEAALEGGHTFHLTVLGPIDRHFNGPRDIDRFTDQWDASSNLIEVYPTSSVRVTGNGRVIWLVNTVNLKEIGLEMFHALSNKTSALNLPRLNNYAGSESSHIILGEVTNEDDMNRNIEIEGDMFSSLFRSYHIAGFGWEE